jgi:hypothetical protein
LKKQHNFVRSFIIARTPEPTGVIRGPDTHGDRPADVRSGARDRFSRPKWIIAGEAADGLTLEMVCALDVDQRGEQTVFITAD